MLLCDVNVLLSAFRDVLPGHEESLALVDALLNGSKPFAVSSSILAATVRIATHPGAFDPPSAIGEALAFCAAIRESDQAVPIEPGREFWGLFEVSVKNSGVVGRAIANVYLGALALEHGCPFVTRDRKFPAIRGLKVVSVEEALASLGE